MSRTNTPDLVTVKPGPGGTVRKSRRITVKRCCDGCGEAIGDVTDREMDLAVAGLPLPSVITEHACQEATA